MSVEIYRFILLLRDPVFWYLFQTAWYGSSNYLNITKVTFCDLFLVTWWNYIPNNTQEGRKFHFSYNLWHLMCYVGFISPQDHYLFDWTRYVVSLPFLFYDRIYLGNINSWRSYYGNIFLLVWYVSWAWKLFSANLIAFAINDFH